MSEFDSLEKSIQGSKPRDVYQFTLGNKTWRLASGIRSISYGGNIYTALPGLQRNEAPVSDEAGSPKQLEITLPMQHPICQRWMASSTPPKVCTVAIYRLQLDAGTAIGLFSGDIVSLKFDRHMATLLVTSTVSRLLGRSLPTITASRTCGHALYDKMCTINRNVFKVTTTVLQVDGRRIKVDGGAGHLSPWWAFGDVYHPGTGERMDIVSQQDLGPPSTVVWLTMQAPIYGLNTGDNIEVSPGCDHTIQTCQSKFANKDNFGGMPQMPSSNPFMWTGLGTIVES